MTNDNRGFASMDPEKQREIASKGGKASGGNFANDPERASEAGRAGGSSRGDNKDNQEGDLNRGSGNGGR